MLKISEIRQMTEQQLREEIQNLEEERFNLRFQRAAYKNPSPARFGQIKRTIAQIKTILREREIETLLAQVEAAKAAK